MVQQVDAVHRKNVCNPGKLKDVLNHDDPITEPEVEIIRAEVNSIDKTALDRIVIPNIWKSA